MKIAIRREEVDDALVLREVLRRAFRRATEADLVDSLRQSCADRIALVATAANVVVGLALFTPVIVRGAKRTIRGMGLWPLAVHPEFQGEGIGSLLVETGISLLKRNGCPFLIVVFAPLFYQRFGFVEAAVHNVQSPWRNIPDNALSIMVFDQETMNGVSGLASFRPEFDSAV